ncbi:MAG: PKD domain-containing protein [Deltaproteobacteria bacterium]|nr:PKD domain-containing protein [Deltaproteobacteria bacterium]
MPPQLFAANPAGLSLEVPSSARIGDIIKVKVSVTGGSEGVWFTTSGLKQIRGYFDHCGWCSTPCLVDDVIQTCSDCCGPYCLPCTWSSGHEFSNTWFGGPTIEYEVTGCGTATVTPTYYGGSHEGPYTLDTYKIKVLDGIVADFEVSGIGCVGDETKFENKSCGGEIYKWYFGDGKSSSEESPVHVYDEEGAYTVSLTAYGLYGNDTKIQTITIVSECATIVGDCLFAPKGSPLPGVEVNGYSSSLTKNNSAVSGVDGHYKMIVAANESYSLLAKKPGFINQFGPMVNLEPDEVYTWNVAMQPDDPEKMDPSSLNGDQPNNVEDPVNPATGNYYFSQSLFKFPGIRGNSFNFQVAYNSSAVEEDGPLGYGWTHSYHIYLTEDGDEAEVHFGDGHKELFRLIATTDDYKAFNCHPSIDLSRLSAGGWKANVGGGFYWEFDSEGRLVRIYDLNNNAIVFEYSTQLDKITDTQGRIIELFYTDGRIVRITSPLVDAGDTLTFTYDSDDNLTGITDPRGHAWAFSYDAGHRLLTETDRRGILVLTNVYDTAGRLIEQRDAKDHKTLLSYGDTSYGTRVNVTMPSNQTYVHEYDSGYNLIGITDTKGLQASLAPGANGKPLSVVDKKGQSAFFESNAHGLPTAVTNRLGISTRINYNDKYQPTSVVDQFGRTHSFGYDAKGNLTTMEDRNFNYTRFSMNSKGQPDYVSYPAYGGTWNLTYSANGSLTSIKDRYKQITGYQYDAAGRIVQVNYPTGFGAFKKQYDANGNLLWQESPLGHRSSFTYNENNQVLTRTFEPTGAVTTYVYDELGRIKTITDPLGGTTTLTYDSIGNVLSIEDPDDVVTHFAYDEQNRLSARTSASGNKTSFGYDPNGNRIWMRNQLGHIWRWTYDADGRQASIQTPMGKTTRYERNEDNTQVRIIDPLDRRIEHRFDDEGNLIGITYSGGAEVSYYRNVAGMLNHLRDERGNSWRYAYDYLGRLARVTDPVNKAETYEYDAMGSLIKLTRRNGEQIQYTYDLDGRLTIMTLPGEINITHSYQYDQNAGTSAITRTDSTGTTIEVYNNMEKLVSRTDVWGKTVAYAYTPAGRLKKIVYADGKDVDYLYDSFGRLQQITDWNGNVTTYSYDAMDRISSVVLPNGTRTVYTYDARNDLVGIRHLKTNGDDLVSLTYTRDALGRIIDSSRTNTPASTATDSAAGFTYDQANRLLTRTSGSETTAYQFDLNGNLLTKTAGTVVTQYTYDSLNRLVSVADGAHTTVYGYNALGTRVSKNYDGIITRYQRFGERILSSLDADDDPNQFNIYSNHLLYSVDPAGSKRIYHMDERGSVIAVSDDSGNLVQSYVYSPYGKVIGSSGSLDNPYGFIGGRSVLTDENGLQHMQARYYDPDIRRFMTEDPLGTAAGANVYAYVGGDPVNRIDPKGLADEESDNTSYITTDPQANQDPDYCHADFIGAAPTDPGSIDNRPMTTYEGIEAISGGINKLISWITPDAIEEAQSAYGEAQFQQLLANTQLLNTKEGQDMVKSAFFDMLPFKETRGMPGNVGGVLGSLSALKLALKNPSTLYASNPYYVYMAGTSVGTASVTSITAVVIIGAVGGWEIGRTIGGIPVYRDPVTGKWNTLDENMQWLFKYYL